jgi:hypothetical protein
MSFIHKRFKALDTSLTHLCLSKRLQLIFDSIDPMDEQKHYGKAEETGEAEKT